MRAPPGRPPRAERPVAFSSWIASPIVGVRASEQVLARPGARFDRGSGERRRAALRKDDAVDARGLGRRAGACRSSSGPGDARGRGRRGHDSPRPRRSKISSRWPSDAPRLRAGRPGARRSPPMRLRRSAGTRSIGRPARRAASRMARSSGEGRALAETRSRWACRSAARASATGLRPPIHSVTRSARPRRPPRRRPHRPRRSQVRPTSFP